VSDIAATILVLQPICDVTAITCGARHAQRSQAGPSRQQNVASSCPIWRFNLKA